MKRRSRLKLSACLAVVLALAGMQPALATMTPLPSVEGPIPVTKRSHPWNGAAWQNKPIDLARYGYVEEEFLASGTANVYDWIPHSDYEVKVTGASPYTTRVIVRRPANMKKFSGRVVLEIINMSAGYDWTAIWSALWETLLDQGDVYVGITSKPNVFGGMMQFDAGRYGKLAMPNPLPAAKQICGTLPGDPAYNPNLSKLYENGLAYDIFSQVGALVRSTTPGNPLGKPASLVFLTGESQSGNYLITYFKYLHNRAKTTDAAGKRRPVFDGYLAEAATTPLGSPINQCATPLAEDDPQRQNIPGRGAPLVMINSQWDFFPYRSNPRKPDSDTRTDKSRTWELAGSNHGWEWQYRYGDARPEDLEKIGFSEYNWTCPAETPEVPLYMAEKALYKHLITWATGGKAPPRAKPITLVGDSYDIAYDSSGNAKGGLRFPMLKVPVATYGAGHYVLSPDCSEIVPFADSKLRRLYPNHAAYVAKYRRAVSQLVRGGFLLPEDGAKLIAQARRADIP